jgi:TM2 domain-containing membrane protein YozV
MSTLPPYPNPQFVFQQQYEAVRRDEVVGVLLALFLGTFGIHHFYLGRVGLGILYCCFFWTGIPAILGFIECFFMPGRVRMYNAVQAAGIAAALGIGIPGYANWGPPVYVSVHTAAPATAAYDPTQAQASGWAPAGAALAGPLNACVNCRHVNPAGSRFCSRCGTPLG